MRRTLPFLLLAGCAGLGDLPTLPRMVPGPSGEYRLVDGERDIRARPLADGRGWEVEEGEKRYVAHVLGDERMNVYDAGTMQWRPMRYRVEASGLIRIWSDGGARITLQPDGSGAYYLQRE